VQKPSSYDIGLGSSSTGSSWNLSSAISSNFGTMQANAWNHIAVSREGANCRCFLNGSLNQTSNFSTTALMTNADPVYIGSGNAANTYATGYIGSLRIVKGTAVYTSNFTPPTAPLTNITNTSLLLNFTNAGIYDATGRNDLETVGDAKISTVQSKFGGSSMAFDGTGDYLITDNSDTIIGFGSGDWTIEFWVRLNNTGTQVVLDGRRSSSADVAPLIYYLSGLKYYTAGGDRISGGTLSAGQWYYIAVVKSSGSTRMYIDGSQTGSTYTDGNTYVQQSQRPVIGAEGVSLGSNPLNGYMQDLRITKGYARYTSNFTPPTSLFPPQ
jgi:Concanavalin A-like lectin/glucanases superfamily